MRLTSRYHSFKMAAHKAMGAVSEATPTSSVQSVVVPRDTSPPPAVVSTHLMSDGDIREPMS